MKYISKLNIIYLVVFSFFFNGGGCLSLAGQRINPSTDLKYLGAFRLPQEKSNGTSWSYGGTGMTYLPKGDPHGALDGFPGSLYSISHDHQRYVSEFTIPIPKISANKKLEELPLSETLQPFKEITNDMGTDLQQLGDIQYISKRGMMNDDKLYWVNYEYYMPPGELQTFGMCNIDLSNLSTMGMWRLKSFNSSATSKYLFEIPEEWADEYLNGKSLAMGRFRLVNGGSWGPSLYASSPWNEKESALTGASIDGIELLKYPDEAHSLKLFGNADGWSDGAWLQSATKSAVIFAGMKSERLRDSGNQYYGAPEAEGCGGKGYHGEPYFACILFYDPDDFINVVQGKTNSYSPQPYAMLQLEQFLFNSGKCRNSFGGVGYDRQNNLLYLLEMKVGSPASVYDRSPICHVFKVIDSGKPPDLTPPSIPTELKVDSFSESSIALSWKPSTDNIGGIIYVVHRNNIPIAITTETRYNDIYASLYDRHEYTVVSRDSVNNSSDKSKLLLVANDGKYKLIDQINVEPKLPEAPKGLHIK